MKAKTLFPVVVALPLAARAQTGGAPSWIVGGYNPAKGPANATGAFSFDGPDLATTDGTRDFNYEVTVSVYSQVSKNFKIPNSVSSVTVVELTRDFDPDKAEDGWSVCMNAWEPGAHVRDSSASLDDPGDCSVALPQTCRSGFPSLYDDEDSCGFPVDSASQCDQFIGDGMASSRDVGDPMPLFSFSSAPFNTANDAAATEAYETERNRVWILQFKWSRTDDNGKSINRVSGPLCIRARDLVQGGVDPGDEDEKEDDNAGTDQPGGDGQNEGDDSGAQRAVGIWVGWGAVVTLVLLAST